MTSLRTLVATTTVLAAGFIGINGVAYATTGHSFLLGKSNAANHTTTLKNTGPGAALKLKTKPGNAPLAVNSTKVVTHLNADLLDGLSASSLQTRGIRYALPNTTPDNESIYALPQLPAGIYQANYNVNAKMSTNGAIVICDFEVNDVTKLLGYGGTWNEYSTVNGGGILDLRAHTATLRCFASDGDFTTNADELTPTVSFVRIDGVTDRNAPLVK